MTDYHAKTTGRGRQPTRISRLISEAETSDLSPEELREQYKRDRKKFAREATAYVREQQQEAKRRRLEHKFGHAGLPEKFQGQSLDELEIYDPRIGRVVDVCRRYVEKFEFCRRFGTCLSLVGNPGTGKTHVATAVLEGVIRQEFVGLFATMSDILRMFRASYNRSDLTEEEVLDHFVEPDLLAIDEVGLAIGNLEKTRAILFDVFDRRYRENKPVILLGNLTAQELEAFLGERIYRRVQENDGSILAFDWLSHADHQKTKTKGKHTP